MGYLLFVMLTKLTRVKSDLSSFRANPHNFCVVEGLYFHVYTPRKNASMSLLMVHKRLGVDRPSFLFWIRSCSKTRFITKAKSNTAILS